MATYRLEVSPMYQRALDAFPDEVREEIRGRIDNALALPVSSTADGHTSTIEVSGHKAVLRLDGKRNVVRIIGVFSPQHGWVGSDVA